MPLPEPTYMGGGEPPSSRKLLGCVLVTFLAVAVIVAIIYLLPHIVCGHGEPGCPGAPG
ncbi:MAG: hypothetical protein M3Z11_02950 [Candidatus Dormibacteraeota bacterium]|nr:hypothetical protein [Candidatus Dormibacteraeota bacterium]